MNFISTAVILTVLACTGPEFDNCKIILTTPAKDMESCLTNMLEVVSPEYMDKTNTKYLFKCTKETSNKEVST